MTEPAPATLPCLAELEAMIARAEAACERYRQAAEQRGLIPASRSLHGPGQPGVAGERAEAAGLGGERLPGCAGGVHDRPVAAAREDAVVQPPLAQVQPDPPSRPGSARGCRAVGGP